ncbi:MAG: flagellar basal body L-ring protein FlgH [Methylophilaceae bacterium]
MFKAIQTITDLIRISNCLLFVTATLLLNACAITPSTIVKTPTTATPTAPTTPTVKTGTIYNAAAYKPLFEDRRARFIGDILTINIVENTSATKTGSSSGSKTGAVDASTTASVGLPLKLPATSVSATSSVKNDDKSDGNNSNNFNGSITVTVVDVQSNGYLVVSGEKQIALDKGTEFVRFSGVINPDTITLGNVVTSSKVADARIEYRTNSKIDGAQIASILSRFFLSFIPL